ncbi:HAMP domain-containing protein [Shewanella sp. 202IG2-18]|uniref:ATP-binding protein n=1 Tax=Parashewanella hymeniacidonis TaxID=2807618 RepID=UPI001960859D|nr:ATP-binding protein [Parashewanella hymeniacidonis]MBM7072585.1 HAMP domain-containing protein [Parashewanella hymeniacidonis]
MPNRIFIKLLLGFWLCSSITLGAVALLPLLQEQHDRAPLPDHLQRILKKTSKRIQKQPLLLTKKQFHGWQKVRDYEGQSLKLYLVDGEGNILNYIRNSRLLRHFMFLVEEEGQPLKHQFRKQLFFGPYTFLLNGSEYSLYGQVENRHPKPWFLYFADNKLSILLIAIILSGLLCSLLAWHLGKPLKQLKQSADKLAQGDLSNRVIQKTADRGDEVGQLARAFNGMANAIEEMLNQQQQLIGNVSHELRTPLTRLQLALALARKKGQQSSEIERIGYEAEQLEELIEELLTLSRATISQSRLRQQTIIIDVLQQVIDDADFEAEQQGKLLFANTDIEDLQMFIYPTLLSRAVENVLRNAVRYAENKVSITVTKSNQNLFIQIYDDGPGIEEKELNAIFEPFYRPDSARDRSTGGWGLGLAITAAAIKAHHGQIAAKNIEPHGLEINISLPINGIADQ